jgi:hypothetical protein
MPPDAREKIGACTFADEDDLSAPLEAADLMAHCWFAHMEYGSADNSPDKEYALETIMARTRGLHRYGKKDFEMLMDIDPDLTPEMREELRAENVPP